ncbi:MAG: hypothetical protein ACUVTM_00660 [Candidatus Bathyarchaeia archaeon]
MEEADKLSIRVGISLTHNIYINLRIVHKDILEFWRAKMLVGTFIMVPILLMSMFGFMFPQTGANNIFSGKVSSPYKNVSVGLVVEDKPPDRIRHLCARHHQSSKLYQVGWSLSILASKV